MSEFLKAAEIAPRLGLSRSRTYGLMQAGLIPVVRRGRVVRVPKAAFEAWLIMQNTTALASVEQEREAIGEHA